MKHLITFLVFILIAFAIDSAVAKAGSGLKTDTKTKKKRRAPKNFDAGTCSASQRDDQCALFPPLDAGRRSGPRRLVKVDDCIYRCIKLKSIVSKCTRCCQVGCRVKCISAFRPIVGGGVKIDERTLKIDSICTCRNAKKADRPNGVCDRVCQRFCRRNWKKYSRDQQSVASK